MLFGKKGDNIKDVLSILKWQEANFSVKSTFSHKYDALFKVSAYLFGVVKFSGK